MLLGHRTVFRLARAGALAAARALTSLVTAVVAMRASVVRGTQVAAVALSRVGGRSTRRLLISGSRREANTRGLVAK